MLSVVQHDRVCSLIYSHLGHVPTADQRRACGEIVNFLFDEDECAAFVLKGYAGTGKTSLVSALIKSAPQLKIRTQLMAPTGRAAKVLSAYSGRKAYTIHKRIYTTVPDSDGMLHTVRAANKFSYTLFIVDEASMIGRNHDVGSGRNLLDDLIDYVLDGNHCRLLLIGDGAQLPPVGAAESPALQADVLEAISPLHIRESELTEVVRQGNQSGILRCATTLRNEIVRTRSAYSVELPLMDVRGKADMVRLPGADLEEALNSEYSHHGEQGVVVVCRSNKRANLFNQAIRSRVLFKEGELCTGDLLMVVKNNYHWLESSSAMGFIANGDIVEVLAVRRQQELYGFHFAQVTLRFVDYPDEANLDCTLLLETLMSEAPALSQADGQRLFASVMEDYLHLHTQAERLAAVYEDAYFNALQVKFAYSLTCHKTQGGQWPVVFVDQGYLTDDMLDREYLRWLYTACTRAKDRLYLINFRDDFFADGAFELSDDMPSDI
ncbi:MAG: AAA family ATPase [Bacteroidales bacterium]|nr:AAA family ATPase [Bacteroidales bacterium]